MGQNRNIIIFSEKFDISTSDIIKWLHFYTKQVFRINRDEDIYIQEVTESKVVLKTLYKNIEINRGDICWFRRPTYYSIYLHQKSDSQKDEIDIFHFQEKKESIESIYYWIIKNCQYITNPFNSVPNKIDVLNKAKIFDVNVPEWVLTEKRDSALSFFSQYNEVITKPFYTFSLQKESSLFKSLTNKISYSELYDAPERFPYPVFFQRYIPKKYELRIFFLKENFYTMAIFSQANNQTEVDFRNYNRANPNRRAPFNLPLEYKQKLVLLMKELGLDTGSIDVLIDQNDEYFFLEVNPVGQFGMTSSPCNYYLEKHIAEKLSQL